MNDFMIVQHRAKHRYTCIWFPFRLKFVLDTLLIFNNVHCPHTRTELLRRHVLTDCNFLLTYPKKIT